MNEIDPCERIETVYYKIGLFSKMNRVTIKTLRHYDEIGLLAPAFIEQVTGYRYYTSEQLPILHQILALREMGFTLEEIKQVQGGVPEQELLQKKRLEIMKKIAAETLRLAQVESYLAKNDASAGEYHVILKELPQVIVASMRTIIPGYDALFQVIPPWVLKWNGWAVSVQFRNTALISIMMANTGKAMLMWKSARRSLKRKPIRRC